MTSAERILRAVRSVPLDPEWVEETVNRLERLVAGGDETGLADSVLGLITDRDAFARDIEFDV